MKWCILTNYPSYEKSIGRHPQDAANYELASATAGSLCFKLLEHGVSPVVLSARILAPRLEVGDYTHNVTVDLRPLAFFHLIATKPSTNMPAQICRRETRNAR